MTRSLAIVLIAAAACGCQGFQRSGDRGGERRDPLYGRYIPKQDLPIPDRKDPLYSAPASRTSRDEPFRNSKSTTVAGLAANVRVEDTGLSLGDRRTPAEPARGVPLRPARETITAVGESFERYAEELRRRNVRYETPTRDANGEYLMQASVPIGSDGAFRRVEASGPSPAAAAKQLLEMIRADD